MNLFLFCTPLLALAVAGNAQDKPITPLTVVPELDLVRYAGTWYEIARLPNGFQSRCLSDVTATYTLLDDGDVVVVNRCRDENGDIIEAEGLAKRAGDDEPNSKLKVRFAPAILSFLPFVWGDYWVILLAPDYTYAVIGEPGRKYLWILSRSPSMDETTLDAIRTQIRQQGYDISGLVMTKNKQP